MFGGTEDENVFNGKILAVISALSAVGVVAVLAVILVTGGYFNGGNNAPPVSDSGGNSTNTPANQDANVILPSQMISLEDATRLLGVDVEN